MRPTELARRTLTTKQSMNHLLAGLEAGGYLDRVEGNGDGRARVLRLTDKGRALTTAIQQIAAGIEQRWATAHGPAAIQQLTATLEDLDTIGTTVPAEGDSRKRER